jgi:hypothetical protein
MFESHGWNRTHIHQMGQRWCGGYFWGYLRTYRMILPIKLGIFYLIMEYTPSANLSALNILR